LLGERCLLVTYDSFARVVFSDLKDCDIDPTEQLRNGRLIRLHGQSTGLQLLGSILTVLEKPYSGLSRIIGCPKLHDPKWPKIEDQIATEAAFNLVLSAHDFLCVYDAVTAPASMIHAHKDAIIDAVVVPNPAYVSPLNFLANLRSDGESADFSPSSWLPVVSD
jgi:hypothetical protein